MADEQALAAEVQARMRPLRARYVETLRARMPVIERVLDRLVNHEFNDEQDRDALLTEAHKLAGTGAIYGFPAISDQGRSLEDALKAGIDGEDPALIGLVADLMDVCHQALALPLETPAAADLPAPAEPAPLRRPQVLVIDQDEAVLSRLAACLVRDAVVCGASSLAEARRLLQAGRPDLVLLGRLRDAATPVLTRLQAWQTLPDVADLPVMLMAFDTQPDEVMRGLMAGAIDYLPHPYDAPAALTKVRKRLWRSQAVVLVADDDEAVRDLLARKLRDAGCKVVVAVDGAQAWDMLRHSPRGHYGLAVLDLMMPGYDGLTLLRMMQCAPELASIPVVFLTARHMSSDVLDGPNTGAADYITKPFNSDEVVARCVRLLVPPARDTV